MNATPDIPSWLIEPFSGGNGSEATPGQNKKQGLAEAFMKTFRAHLRF